MKIKLNNGKEFEYITAIETEEFFNGLNRRTLTFECDKNAITVDELNDVLSIEDNLKEIILINEEMNTSNIYDGYVLKLKCGVENKLITSETPDEQAVYEDRIIFKLGKRTYIEEQLKRLGL